MSGTTSIQWCDRVWNPTVGCSAVSSGCAHCYAERLAHRGMTAEHRGLTRQTPSGPRWTGEVRSLINRLANPLRWRKPARIFVNSMSDLFHEAVPDEFIDQVFAIMALAQQHTFIVLTKRPARMRKYFEGEGGSAGRLIAVEIALEAMDLEEPDEVPWPLPNVILGVSVEDQRSADERIPLLLDTPAAVRAVSYEPALGPVDFTWLRVHEGNVNALCGTRHDDCESAGVPETLTPRLDWLILGGESGPCARPFEVAWARSAIAQGRAADVPVFVKQLGARPVEPHPAHPGDSRYAQDFPLEVHDSSGGDPREWPEDLRVRQFPELMC